MNASTRDKSFASCATDSSETRAVGAQWAAHHRRAASCGSLAAAAFPAAASATIAWTEVNPLQEESNIRLSMLRVAFKMEETLCRNSSGLGPETPNLPKNGRHDYISLTGSRSGTFEERSLTFRDSMKLFPNTHTDVTQSELREMCSN